MEFLGTFPILNSLPPPRLLFLSSISQVALIVNATVGLFLQFQV